MSEKPKLYRRILDGQYFIAEIVDPGWGVVMLKGSENIFTIDWNTFINDYTPIKETK